MRHKAQFNAAPERAGGQTIIGEPPSTMIKKWQDPGGEPLVHRARGFLCEPMRCLYVLPHAIDWRGGSLGLALGYVLVFPAVTRSVDFWTRVLQMSVYVVVPERWPRF